MQLLQTSSGLVVIASVGSGDETSDENDRSESESDSDGSSTSIDDEDDELTFSSAEYVTSDESSGSDEACTLPTHPLIAKPPEILEACHYITKEVLAKGCFGYRICGDNIDKTIHARYMRIDKRNSSLHYFHSYAVLNCIDVSTFLDGTPDIRKLNSVVVADNMLPSRSDDQALKENFAKLVSRVLVEHLRYFKLSFEDVVDWHIKHQFSEEMAKKSVVVSIVNSVFQLWHAL